MARSTSSGQTEDSQDMGQDGKPGTVVAVRSTRGGREAKRARVVGESLLQIEMFPSLCKEVKGGS